MTEYERRLAAANKAVHDLGRDGWPAKYAYAAIEAFNAPLPPELQLVTDEMSRAALAAYSAASGNGNHNMMVAIEAAMLASPVIKAAQAWRKAYDDDAVTITALAHAIDEAGL